jgi:hypothetical protein
MTPEKKSTIRMVAAIVGAGAVLALAGMNAVLGGQSTSLAVHLPPPPPTVGSPAMSMGATTTTIVPASALATTKAKPAIKGPAALPSEEAGLP